MTKSKFDKIGEAIKNMPLKKREPMWDQAIKYLVDEGAMEPTVRMDLSVDEIDVIITNETDCSSYDLISECGKWIEAGDNVASYLSLYFFNTNEVWLAYLMGVYHAMEWDGEKWVSIGKENHEKHL